MKISHHQTETIILSALAIHPMHGYALSGILRKELPQTFKFGVGMLYPILHKLEKRQLIVGEWRDVAGQQKKVYSLTKKGKKEQTELAKQWAAFSGVVSKFIKRTV